MTRKRNPRPPTRGDGTDSPVGKAAWLDAVLRGDEEQVRQYLAAGCAVDWQDDNGCSLLFHALFRRHFKVAERLLAAGANIDSPDRHGWTPLFWAAFNGHAEIVAFLLAHGANANQPTPEGDWPLFMAAFKGHDEVARLLLAGGARWEAIDPKARHALSWVAKAADRADIVNLLEACTSPVPPAAGAH